MSHFHFLDLRTGPAVVKLLVWSGRRGSNPRHPPWQGGTLPLSYARVLIYCIWFCTFRLAEKAGFEPAGALTDPAAFPRRCLQPLGHFSIFTVPVTVCTVRA